VGNATTIAANAVTTSKVLNSNITYAKIQNVTASNTVLGRVSTGAGEIEEIATTGTGNVVRATSPTLTTPNIGAATGTSLTLSGQLNSTVAIGTAPFIVTSTTPVANLQAATVTTNANLTGDVTSVGNTSTIAANAVTTAKISNSNVTYAKIQNVSATDKILGRVSAGAGVVEEISTTGSGTVVRSTSPTLTTPILGDATATRLNLSGQLVSSLATGTAPFVVLSTTPVANLHAATASQISTTLAGTNNADLLYSQMADNDFFRIRVGGTASNAGFAEIATADDGTEPIYVRQYSGVFGAVTRTATLLDESGNSTFPGSLKSNGIISNISSKNGNYTLTLSDEIIIVTNTATITLPTAIGNTGRTYTIKRYTTSGNTTINTTSGQLIDGISTYILDVNKKAVKVVSDGANWYTIASF